MVLMGLDKKQIDPIFYEQIQNHPRIQQIIQPLEADLEKNVGVHISLVKLRQMACERPQLVHEHVKSVAEQRSFFVKLHAFHFPVNYPFVQEVTTMICLLEQLDTDPEKSKLRHIT